MPALTLDDLFRRTSDGGALVALDPEGRLAHVDEVRRGKVCGCRCIGCGRPVIARHGEVLAHSFAHYSNFANPACATAGETALHKVAKDYLADALVLTLPGREIERDGLSETVVRERTYPFDSAEVEKFFPGFRPDVLVHKGGRPLLVEFKVTHACGDEKISRIRERDIAALEIDLEPYRSRRLDELGPAILHEARRTWLHNPKDRDASERLEERLRQRADAIQADAERRLAAYGAVVPGNGPYAKAAAENDLMAAVGRVLGGAGCFEVPAEEWQASILLALWGDDRLQTVRTLVEHLERERLVRPAFMKVPPDVRAIMQNRVALPEDAVVEFLRWAAGERWVRMVQGKWYRTTQLTDTVDRAKELQERPRTRRKRVDAMIRTILESVPSGDRAGFDLEAWWRRENPDLGRSPASTLRLDESDWAKFEAALTRLQDDFRWRPERVQDDLGLPIAKERERRVLQRLREVEDRKRQQEERSAREMEARIHRITQEAQAVFVGQAAEWLAAKLPELDGRTPLEAARQSAEFDTSARNILSTENDRRRRQAFPEATKIEALSRLEMRASRVLGSDERAALWIRSANPGLGRKSPRDHCVNQATMEECLRALEEQR